jgi:hypothetical protein
MMMERQSLREQVDAFFRELSVLRISGGLDTTTIVSRLAQAKAYTSITSLSCYRIYFNDDITPCVLDLLRSRQKWDILDLRSCTGQVEKVIDTIFTHCVVNRFSLTDLEHFSDDASMALGRGMVVANNNKSQTSLSQLHLNVPLQTSSVRNVMEGLSRTTTLTELDLSGCHWNDLSVSTFSQALHSCQSIQTLALRRCNLEDSQVAAIVRGLASHPSLTSLNLQNNACSTNTLAALSQILSNNSQVSKLSTLVMTHGVLSEDRISGLTAFFAALGSRRCSLTEVVLEQFMLVDDDMAQLTSSLKQNNLLESLSLTTCGITSKGIDMFATGFPEMRGLRRLSVPGDAVAAISNALVDNVYLQILEFPPDVQSIPRGMSFYLDLNRGGRRILHDFDIGPPLFPNVLARANNVSYMHGRSQGSDVIYSLLRGRILLENNTNTDTSNGCSSQAISCEATPKIIL